MSHHMAKQLFPFRNITLQLGLGLNLGEFTSFELQSGREQSSAEQCLPVLLLICLAMQPCVAIPPNYARGDSLSDMAILQIHTNIIRYCGYKQINTQNINRYCRYKQTLSDIADTHKYQSMHRYCRYTQTFSDIVDIQKHYQIHKNVNRYCGANKYYQTWLINPNINNLGLSCAKLN